MTLQNLLAIQRLLVQPPDAGGIRKLLQAARRNLADAQVDAISADTRFDAAYKCVMQCAMLGLWANGYRTATSQPGHHQTAIQTLGLTMGVKQPDIIVLDALRRKRNLADYEGDQITPATLDGCIEQATRLLAHTESWLKRQNPAWVEAA